MKTTPNIIGFLLTILATVTQVHCRHTESFPSYQTQRATSRYTTTTIVTNYGSVRGKTFSVSDCLDLDIFHGIPYAQPPTGDLRLTKPERVSAWAPATLDATRHGAQCKGQIIPIDEVLEGVPFSEDCLFLDIYSSRPKDSADNTTQPVMVYLHPGGYYGGSGAKYNYTNLALKGVVVVSVSFRLDVLGFLSTEDDVIPGNFGLFDAAMALDFVKKIIGDFRGNPDDVTLFGSSSGAAMVSIFTLSPLTRGSFHKAIIQSGPSLAPWAVYTPGRDVLRPRQLAVQLGRGLNCSLPETDDMSTSFSSALLTCFRSTHVDDLLAVSLNIQEQTGLAPFVPVTNDSFGFLPETPEALLARPDQLPAIPTIWGYTRHDGSWLVPDPSDDGITVAELLYLIETFITVFYPTDQIPTVRERVYSAYNLHNISHFNAFELRTLAVDVLTDASSAAFTVKQARLFSQTSGAHNSSSSARTYVYEFNYRPSYTEFPQWHGVAHSVPKGIVLGLPAGPDAFSYPSTTAEDRLMADMVTDLWATFAKTGSPNPLGKWAVNVTWWPEFGHSTHNQEILLIQPDLAVKEFDRMTGVWAFTGYSGIPDLDS